MIRLRHLSFAVLSIAAFAAAQQGPAPADSLPASTWAMASFAGFDRCGEAVGGHRAAKLLKSFYDGLPQDVREQRVVAMLEQVAAQLREGEQQTPLRVAALRGFARRPMALGIGRPTILGWAPSLALVVDEGNSGQDLDALLAQLAAARPEPTRLQKGSVAGLACTLVEGDGMPTLYAVHEAGTFVFTNSEGYLREILAVKRGEQPSISSATHLGAQRARMQEQPLVEVFVNASTMAPMFAPFLPYETADFGRALGIESFGGAYLAAGPSGEGTVETLDLQIAGAKDGLLKAALSGQVDFEAARYFDKETVAFAALRIDANALPEAFDRMLALLPREAARDMRRDVTREFLRGFRGAGITDAEVEELFGSMHGSITAGFSFGTAPAPIPGVTAVLRLRDVAAATRWLDRVRNATVEQGLQWKVRMQGDTTIHYCSAPISGEGGIELTPSYAIHDGNLVIGSTTKVVLDALKQRADESTSLFRETDFTVAMLAEEGAMGLVHLRPGRLCERRWGLAETWVLPQIDANQEELGFSSEDLPEPEDIAAALGTSTVSLTCDGDGLRLRMRGNLGLGGVAACFCVLADEVLARANAKTF
jgi:hypothetical protein